MPDGGQGEMSFVYQGQPGRLLFGSGTVDAIGKELDMLGVARALVLSTPEQAHQARKVASHFADRLSGYYPRAVMHTPVETTQACLSYAREIGFDGIVSIGGGSTTGLGKALAFRSDLPHLVVPTTYAGSEVTSILGETRDGIKTTQRDARILPETVVYDVDLTLGLPVPLSVVSGLNAMAHAVEALYARDRNPVVSLMALEGIRDFVAGLPAIVSEPGNSQARSRALKGAWLCGLCLSMVTMALHHKLCHTIGGALDLPHAQTHAILLPHTLAYNQVAAPDAMNELATILGGENASIALFQFAKKLGAPLALRDLGMRQDQIEIVADLAMRNPYWNPLPLDLAEIRGLIQRAWSGAVPEGH